MKMFAFVEKRKSIIAAIISILIIALAAVLFYKYEVADNHNRPIKSYTIGGITSVDDSITVSAGQTLVQNYINDNLNYEQIGFAAQATSKDALLTVSITDGKQLQTETFKQNELSTGYTYIELDNNLKTLNKVDLKLSFTAQKGNFVFSANKSIDVPNSSCTLDETDCEKNIVVDLRTLKNKIGDAKYIILASAIILFLVAMVVLIKCGCKNIAVLTAIALSFFCVICFAIFPPFTVPDEKTHFLSSYHVSNMQRFDFTDEQAALRMRACDYEYMENSSNSLFSQGYVKEKGFDKFLADDIQTVTTKYGYMTNKAVPHFMSGLGINVARLFRMGPYWTFQMSRLFNAIMCIAMIYFAIKIIPYGKIALAAISLIPINLHIMASCSYDNFTFGGVILLFAYIVYLTHADKQIGWKQLLILAIMIALVVPQKIVYIGVAALLLVIPKEKFSKPRLHFVFKCCLGLMAVVAIFAFQLNNASKVTAETVTNSTTAGYNIGYVLGNPGQMVMMLYETILKQSDFYVKSLISFFGWFEFQTPWFMAMPYIAVLCIAFMRKSDEPKAEGFVQRMYALVLFGIVFLLIEFLLLVDHTPMGSATVLGVQGRYFIPALPLLFFFLRNNTVELKKSFDTKMMFLLVLLNSGIFIYCSSQII